jgi:predicted regulator of Ras-like GTPase activity (Roadblock/LC7/MglB family)
MAGAKEGLKQTVLSEEQGQEVKKILKDLRRKAQLSLVILLDASGQSILHAARSRKAVRNAVSALIAGNFAASAELSKLVGETMFRCLFHEGEKVSVYACKVGDDFILLTVFPSEVRFGLVKLYTTQSIKKLEEILKEVCIDQEEQEEIEEEDTGFEDELDMLLEQFKKEFSVY